MPLDIALSTNTPTATIELRQAQAMTDGRHLAAFLVVRSGAFAAALAFVFAVDELVSFVEALDELYATRSGVAALRGWENDNVIRFESIEEGAMRVSGRLHEETAQELIFSFVTQREGLSTLLDGFRQLRAGDAT